MGFATNGCSSVSCLSRRQDSPAINRFGYFPLCSDKYLTKQCKGRQVCFGSQCEGTACHGREGMATLGPVLVAGDIAERDECWCSVGLLLFAFSLCSHPIE